MTNTCNKVKNVAEYLRNNIERHLPVQLVKNYPDERMDRTEKANKDKMSDLVEVERKNKDDKTVVVYQPKDVEVIDTSAFIKTKMHYGLDFVFRLVDAVVLTIFTLTSNNMWCVRCCLGNRCLPLSAPAWLETRRCSSPQATLLARPLSSSSTPRTSEVTTF